MWCGVLARRGLDLNWATSPAIRPLVVIPANAGIQLSLNKKDKKEAGLPLSRQ
jgi:hypothetical protein